MKPRSLLFRPLVGNLLLVAAIVAVSFAISYRYLNAEHRARDEARQLSSLHVLRHHFERVWEQLPAAPAQRVAHLDRQCKALMASSPARLTVIAADGQILGDSDPGAVPAEMTDHRSPDRPEVMAALEGRPGRHVRVSGTLGREFRYFALPVRRDGRVVGVVRLAMPAEAIVKGRSFILHVLAWSALAAVLASVVLGLLIRWIWSRPLRQITRTARRIASGDLTARATVSGAPELAELATALNRMRENIAADIELIATAQANLETAMANLRDGAIALDELNRIVLINPAAMALLAPDAEPVTGRHVQAVIPLPELAEVIEALADGEPVCRQCEIRRGAARRVIELHATRVAPARRGNIRALLVVRDMTEATRVATVKTEFVANASHELRTPLATIRAAVDSLAAAAHDDPDAVARITEILDRHVRRLENMTGDLLALHRLEQARGGLDIEPVEPAALAAWVRGSFALQAGYAGVQLDVRAEPDARAVRSDRRMLEWIVQNLVDNAIKFTPDGGRVECAFGQADTDTGCGMAPEVQSRVFERFYRADTSHSGPDRTRGTGLGLAIVKYAAERLDATVDLVSAPGRGTTVTVAVPDAGGTTPR